MARRTGLCLLALSLAAAASAAPAQENGPKSSSKALDQACTKLNKEKPKSPSKSLESKCRRRRAELKEVSRKEKAAQAERRKSLAKGKEQAGAQVPQDLAKNPSDTSAQSKFFDLGGLSDSLAALPSASGKNHPGDQAAERAKPRSTLPADFRSKAPAPPAPGGAPQAIIDAALTALHGGKTKVRRGGMAIDTDGDLSNADKAMAAVARRDPDRQTKTAMTFSNGRSLDPTRVPYVVIPGGDKSAKVGDLVVVEYQGRRAMAVVGDVGPRNKFGEGSMALAKSLGINSSGVSGGVQSGVSYTFLGRGVGRHPRSAADVTAALEQSELALAAGR